MRFRSLEGRIASLFLLLLIAVQVSGLFLIQRGIDSNARSAVKAELLNGSKVFSRVLEQNAQTLRFGARLLARDTAFVAAVGNDGEGDRATIESALANHGGRINAALTMLLSAERQIVAATSPRPPPGLEKLVRGMLDRAEQADGASGIGIIELRPYQVVVIPVKAPLTIGWVVMTFPIDARQAGVMHDISALQASIMTRSAAGRWMPVGSTLAPPAAAALVAQMQARGAQPDASFELDIAGSRYSLRQMAIGSDQGQTAVVLLARSLDEATAEYARLEHWLLVLALLGIFVSGVVAVLTAKRIAQPLSQLAQTARRLERGDYKDKIAVARGDEVGALAQALDSMRDGIARREQEIRRLAYWDTLTNLPNRAQFLLHLNESLAAAEKQGGHVYVLMMDLDRFKHVNDVLGQHCGDALLRQVGERLLALMARRGQGAGQLARLGGDEFAILLPGAGLDRAIGLAAEILQALETPLALGEQTVDIGAGLGIAGYPEHGADGESLLGMAEVAMYTAKQRRDGAVVYDAMFDQGSAKSLSLLTELRSAVEGGQLRLFVQPKITLASGVVSGAEALVRWAHPERGNVFPDQFIPFAEQTGFIRVLTRWVLEQSALLCHQLAQQGVHLKLSVNLSTRDLMDQDLPAKFAEITQRYSVSPGAFCLEITESAIMDDPVRAQHTLERLHAMGADISIDDFGTGYSSLAYLKRLPVDELKIDKSFVLNMEQDVGDSKIVRSTIDLGHNMGLRVVAEGVESEAVWGLLKRMGCDQGQGYFMSRPMPAAELAGWIARWRAPEAAAGASAAAENGIAPAK